MQKQVLGVQSSSHWHRRLGHPSFVVVRKILQDNEILFSESNKELVCDACQKPKSHQLPYPTSTSVSTSPLELVFYDVWGPATFSVGRNKYYVSFIDDYSKFTWIYMIKCKSDVFQNFHDFQHHVERLFDKNILVVQLTGAVSIINSAPFSNVWVFLTISRVPMLISRMDQLSVSIIILLRLTCLF
jgi:hypothetical protein